MGEAKRRRQADVIRQGLAAGRVYATGLMFAEIERLGMEDPGDRQDREAHGIPFEADFLDPSQVCRNGCGLRYLDIVSGKIRNCAARP